MRDKKIMLPIDHIDKFLARRLRFFREKMDWPLKTLAAKLNISLQQLQRYEQGTNKLSASLLYQITQLFNLSLDSFFEGIEKNEEEKDCVRILLVEDNTHDEFLFREALNDFKQEYHLYVIKDGLEAFRFIQEDSNSSYTFDPNIVFLDINLPNTTGFELLQAIKRRPLWHDKPVVILSTSPNDEDIARSYHLNASSFIRKCFDFKTFRDQINQTLNYWSNVVQLPKSGRQNPQKEVTSE